MGNILLASFLCFERDFITIPNDCIVANLERVERKTKLWGRDRFSLQFLMMCCIITILSALPADKKAEARSRVDRDADNQQLLQLEEKDVVSSVATVLSDLCGPGEWMPMEKLHTEVSLNCFFPRCALGFCCLWSHLEVEFHQMHSK